MVQAEIQRCELMKGRLQYIIITEHFTHIMYEKEVGNS